MCLFFAVCGHPGPGRSCVRMRWRGKSMGSHLSFRSAEEAGRDKMKREMMGKVTGSQSSFRSVEEMGRNRTILLIRHQNFNRELHGKRRRRGESESEGNWKERGAIYLFISDSKGLNRMHRWKIFCYYFSLFQSRLYFSPTRKQMPISSTMTHDELHLKIIRFFFASLSEVLTAF